MTDIVERLRKSGMPIDADIDPDMIANEIETLRQRVNELKAALECERTRLAFCGVAALGYFDGCLDEYRSASLDDVLRLRAELATLKQAQEPVAYWNGKGSIIPAEDVSYLPNWTDYYPIPLYAAPKPGKPA